MNWNPPPDSLLFSDTQSSQLPKNHAAYQKALDWLKAAPDDVVTPANESAKSAPTPARRKRHLSPLGQAMQAAYRYRFLNDEAQLEPLIAAFNDDLGFTRSTRLNEMMDLVAAAQTYALLRPHSEAETDWLKRFNQKALRLQQTDERERDYLEYIWQIPLQMARAALLNQPQAARQAIETFQHVIDHDIHPEGYIKPAVDVPDAKSGTFLRQTLAVTALTLAAEIATQSGVNLWKYENRGVGVNTAAAYLVYYYFYPDKWLWHTQVTEEETREIFLHYGAFIEIVTYRAYPRGVEVLLDQSRPFFGVHSGGLTTLTHLTVPHKQRRRWFGF